MRVLFLILITIILGSCKETYCPAFPPKLLEYLPYSNSDELKFKNSNNDTLILKVYNDWASDSYSFDWNCKCSCGSAAGFETDISSNFPLKLVGNINVGENNFELICNFYDSTIHNDVLSYFKEGLNLFNVEQQSNLPDTIFIERQIFNRIGNVKIIKNKGIVEFWDKKHNCSWIVIEKKSVLNN